jgi:hypothetical protein
MIQKLINAFDWDIAPCLVETDSELIEIFDCYDGARGQLRCYIKIEDNEPVHFELKNPLRSNLTFAAIDNCILLAHQQSRCDFFIGNLQKLYFVEIKRVNKGQRRQARDQAIRQLDFSISLFKGKLDLSQTELIAVICLKAKLVRPLQSATRMADMVAFKEKHNATLMEGQTHTF